MADTKHIQKFHGVRTPTEAKLEEILNAIHGVSTRVQALEKIVEEPSGSEAEESGMEDDEEASVKWASPLSQVQSKEEELYLPDLQEVKTAQNVPNADTRRDTGSRTYQAAVYFDHSTGQWVCDQCKRFRIPKERIRSLQHIGSFPASRVRTLGPDVQGVPSAVSQVDSGVSNQGHINSQPSV